jgi:hypothetical protein
MARHKGKSARGKSRVSQAPIPTREELLATAGRSVMTIWLADGHCPLCAPTDAELRPYGHAETIERAAVSPVQPGIGS